MASNKRRPDKSKRQRQNRAAREARAARSARAGEATEIHRGEREPVHAESSPAGDTAATSRTGSGRSRARAERAARPSRYQFPGQRAVVLAFLFTLVSAVTLLIAPVRVERIVEADDPRIEADAEANEDGTFTIFEDSKLFDEEEPGLAVAIIGLPILITGAAAYFSKRPNRGTIWSISLVLLAAYIFFLAGPYGIIALPSLIAIAVGNFQRSRADAKKRMAEIKADREARAADGDDPDGDDPDGDDPDSDDSNSDDPDDDDLDGESPDDDPDGDDPDGSVAEERGGE